MHLSINKTDLGGIYMYRIFLYDKKIFFAMIILCFIY